MKKAVLALLAGGLLLPVAGSAGRLDDDFMTQDETAGENNEACIEADGDNFSARGTVIGQSGECEVRIQYTTDLPHKASSTALKGTKTEGSAKVSQSVNTDLQFDIVEGPGAGTCLAADILDGSAAPEKCKATASLRGTSVATGADTVQSSRVSVSCDLGDGLAEIEDDGTTADDTATAAEVAHILAAFADRDDVRVDENGKLQIRHDGVADSTTPQTCN